MKFFISKSKKLPREAQKELLPSKEFMIQGKDRFLAAFDASTFARDARAAQTRRAYVAAFFKTGIGVVAALCVGVGLSAYADTTNVSATSPLYPLKRLSENVRLTLAAPPEKAQLQATFAVRRANEIAALQTSAPSSTLIPQLTSDLDEDISSSLAEATGTDVGVSVAVDIHAGGASSTPGQVPGERGVGHGHYGAALIGAPTSTTSTEAVASGGPVNIYCAAFDKSTSSVFFAHLESSLVLHPRILAQFNKECGSDSRGGGASTTNVTSSVSVIGGHARNPIKL